MTIAEKNYRPIISKRQAMSLIPMCDKESRDFLQSEGLVHKIRGRDMVVIRELEECIMSFDANGAREGGE